MDVRTEAIYVVFTGITETRAAVRVARPLSAALGAPLTVIDFRAAPNRLEPNPSDGAPPTQAEAFTDSLRQHGLDANLRVYVCRDPRRAFDMVFRPHSLIVLGGSRRWWPTRSTRMRRALESAGHFVLFVDEAAHAS